MRLTNSNGIENSEIIHQFGESPAPSTKAAARIGDASTMSTMPIAANARRSVRLDAAIETDVSAADTAMPDTRIRNRVATQLPGPSGPEPSNVYPSSTSSGGPIVTRPSVTATAIILEVR